MAKKCDICNETFKNALGVTVHKRRTPACGGKQVSWTSARKMPRKRGRGGETGKQAIHRILADHPQGLPVKQILTELSNNGFKVASGYVTQTAAADSEIVKVERGVYRLKNNLRQAQQTGTTVVQQAVAEVKAGLTDMPREALLLRIEMLENQTRALQDAHMALVRGAFV